jgi:hypothetical protein
MCLRAARRQGPRMRAFWLLLGAACALWTLGESIWAVYDLILRTEVPLPSWADVGYLGAVPLAAAALVAHPTMRGRGANTARSLLDGIVAATALLFLSWTLVLGPLWRSTDLTTAGGIVALAYPFSDVVIVCLIALVVRRITSEHRFPLWCLLAGLMAMAFADSTYAYLTGASSYGAGQVIDAAWFAGYAAIAVAAFSSRSAGEHVSRSRSSAPALAPVVAGFVPMLVALVVITVETQRGHRPAPAAFAMALALVGLSLARQALVLFELAARGGSGGSFATRLNAALVDSAPQESAGR